MPSALKQKGIINILIRSWYWQNHDYAAAKWKDSCLDKCDAGNKGTKPQLMLHLTNLKTAFVSSSHLSTFCNNTFALQIWLLALADQEYQEWLSAFLLRYIGCFIASRCFLWVFFDSKGLQVSSSTTHRESYGCDQMRAKDSPLFPRDIPSRILIDRGMFFSIPSDIF